MILDIDSLAPTGEGVARPVEQPVVFVFGAGPGDRVDARPVLSKTRWSRAVAETILRAGPGRRAEPCPHAVRCGGCDWPFLDLETQRSERRRLFLETLRRLGGIDPHRLGEIETVASPLRYRLRNRFHVTGTGRSAEIGFFGPWSNRLEPLATCEIVTPEMLALLPAVGEAIRESGIAVRELATLEQIDGGRRVARWTFADQAGSLSDARLEPLRRLFDGAALSTRSGVLVDRIGIPEVTMRVAGAGLTVSVDSFFQTNRYLVEPLFEEVRARASELGGSTALDLYAGVGFLTAALVAAGFDVTSVESAGAAAADAERNRIGLAAEKRWRVLRGDVRQYLESAPPVDVAVADPPRAGLGRRVSRTLGSRARRGVILLSCNPSTLARDLPVLLEGGLKVRRTVIFDMFPNTHHTEAVITLDRSR